MLLNQSDKKRATKSSKVSFSREIRVRRRAETAMATRPYCQVEGQQDSKPILSGRWLKRTQGGGWAALHTLGREDWKDRTKVK